MFISSSPKDHSTSNMLSLVDRFNSQSATYVGKLIRQAALTDSCVIITGEINTGKRWTARGIHEAGKHSEGPFHEVSCLAMSNDRVKRELFGHITYSPEGIAINHKVFQKADGGTLLIDSFNLLPTEMQLHLVSIMEQISTQRVINQQGEVLDVQLILTLDEHAYSVVKEEEFWKSLVERINPIYINEPAVRERREDIPILVKLFLEQLAEKYQVPQPSVSLYALHQFIKYEWPGNLRQLRNAVEYALILSDGSHIEKTHLPNYMLKKNSNPHNSKNDSFLENNSLFTAERHLFKEALRVYKNIDRAAKRLEINKGVMVHRLGSSATIYEI